MLKGQTSLTFTIQTVEC